MERIMADTKPTAPSTATNVKPAPSQQTPADAKAAAEAEAKSAADAKVAEEQNAKNAAATADKAGEDPVVATADVEKKTYYLKPNATHTFIKDGEMVTIDEVGTPVELSAAGFKSFGDKFSEHPPKKAEPAEGDKPEDGE
jgi:membrane protein involved in colicin uptake